MTSRDVLLQGNSSLAGTGVSQVQWSAGVGGVQLVFGEEALARLDEVVGRLGGGRVLLISDPGIAGAGHLERAVDILRPAVAAVMVFAEIAENPTTLHVKNGCRAAADFRPDVIVALGGGSVMDCAKAVNLLHTNGGEMEDYRGYNRATEELLPAVAVPTTAGTGSDAQSYAIISGAEDRRKMACGDEKVLFRTVILDPLLAATCPTPVAAASGLDAVAHAIESHVSAAANPVSRIYSLAAWTRLERNLEASLTGDPGAGGEALLAAHLAGAAIEQSMLGAAHGLTNPLTAELGVTHGLGLAVVLPQVIRFNAPAAGEGYAELAAAADLEVESPAEALAGRVEELRAAGGMPGRLRDLGVGRDDLATLASEAAQEWTTGHNPRSASADELATIYEAAW